MEIITNSTPTNTTSNGVPVTAKSSEPESETPTRIQQPGTAAKPLAFSNGVLKRHLPHHLHAVTAVTYKECLKNHVASLGGHALDGCGEFMPSPNATADDPTSIKCAACGCHRNFHRREPEEPIPAAATRVFEYQPHHRHHPPPPPPFQNRSPNSASPPPISSYPSAPHMLLALSSGGGLSVPPESTAAPSPTGRKRFRTKFTQEQKEKMHAFAERVGWKMQKRDDETVMEFCNEIGVDRGVLKVWMHNNKNNFAKKENNCDSNGGAVRNLLQQEHDVNGNGNGNGNTNDGNKYENDSGTNGGTNGSSSSS